MGKFIDTIKGGIAAVAFGATVALCFYLYGLLKVSMLVANAQLAMAIGAGLFVVGGIAGAITSDEEIPTAVIPKPKKMIRTKTPPVLQRMYRSASLTSMAVKPKITAATQPPSPIIAPIFQPKSVSAPSSPRPK